MMNARLEELRSKFQENPRRYFAPFANELRKAGDPAQAISVCRAHLAGQPGHVSGHIVLGQALYEAGEANEARDVFSAALELDPENLIALRTLGEIAQVNGEFAMARQWYERLLDADPRNTEVAQLLKDIPDVRASEPMASSATATEVEEAEPTPLSARIEIEKEPEPTPVSKFHTTFSGVGPAYRPEQPEEEEPAQETSLSELAEAGQVDQPTEAVAESPTEPFVAAVPSEPAESLDMVDLDTFPSSMATTEPSVESSLPDESYAASEDQAPDDLYEMEIEPPMAQHEAPEAEETVETAPMAEADTEMESEFAPSPPLDETPRALFAENGFEGPADDHVDWMTTPSATFSDLEAAPEDWYDESSAGTEEVTAESVEVTAEPAEATAESVEATAESVTEEPAATEARVPDPYTDSWFDDVEGATTIESTEVSSEEFWLPPELPYVTSHEETSAPVAEFQEAVAEAQAPVESHEEVDSLAMAAAPQAVDHVEPENFSIAAADNTGDDVVVIEHPDEVSMASTLPEPDASEQMEEPQPQAIESTDFDSHDVDYAAVEATIVTPADTDAFIGHTPSFNDAVATPPPAPFVTETLAELYLQQGFRDEALAIYRQLAERAPSDQTLQNRIAAIEQGKIPEAAPAAEAAAENRAASQSVRSFFSRLARRPAAPLGSSQPDAAKPGQEVPFAAAASALANLFAASKPAASDEGAAATLAGAFTDPAGRPSRADDRELSLDHLFRDVPPGGSASGGVSLDEFYATPSAPPGSTTEPGEESESAESGGTDIRQFTAWLEGLRKK